MTIHLNGHSGLKYLPSSLLLKLGTMCYVVDVGVDTDAICVPRLLDEWEEKEKLRERSEIEKQRDMAELKRRLELQEEIERELENAARNYSSQVSLWP